MVVIKALATLVFCLYLPVLHANSADFEQFSDEIKKVWSTPKVAEQKAALYYDQYFEQLEFPDRIELLWIRADLASILTKPNMVLEFVELALSYPGASNEQLYSLYTLKGGALNLSGQEERAIEAYEESMQYVGSGKIRDRVGNMLKIASIYTELSRHEKGIEILTEARELAEQSEDVPSMINVEGYLGNIYTVLEDYEKALGHYKTAYEQVQENLKYFRSDSLAVLSYNVADMYSRLERLDEANSYYQQCLEHSKAYRNVAVEAYALTGLVTTGDYSYEKRVEMLERAIEIFDESSFVDAGITGRNKLIGVHIDAGKPAKAIPVYEQLLSHLKERKPESMYRETILKFSKTLAMAGQFEKAYKYLYEFIEDHNEAQEKEEEKMKQALADIQQDNEESLKEKLAGTVQELDEARQMLADQQESARAWKAAFIIASVLVFLEGLAIWALFSSRSQVQAG